MCIVPSVWGVTVSDVHRYWHCSQCLWVLVPACVHTYLQEPLICFCASPGQILKLCPKKKSSFTYTFCKAVGLLGMRFHLFENECESRGLEGGSFFPEPRCPSFPAVVYSLLGCGWVPDYSHGITLATPLAGSEKKQVLHFCALGSDEMQKFVEDLKESIAEVTELEQIRIECKDGPQFLRPTDGVQKVEEACIHTYPCLVRTAMPAVPRPGPHSHPLLTLLRHPIPMWARCFTTELSPASQGTHMDMHTC